MARDRDEIVGAQRLIQLEVVLLLVDLAIAVERHLVLGAAGGEPGAGAAAGQVTGFDHAEHAPEIELADRTRGKHAHVVAGGLGAQVDGAANSRSSRAVDVGGAEVDIDLLDQFGVDLLVRVDRIVARIVQRNAVEGQADATGIEAADVERAAGRTVGVVVLEADARDLVDRVEHGLARCGAFERFAGQHGLGLGRVGRGNAFDLLHGGAGAGDDDFGFEVLRTGRLGEGRAGDRGDTDGQGAGRGAESGVEAHSVENPCFCHGLQICSAMAPTRARIATPGRLGTLIVERGPRLNRPGRQGCDKTDGGRCEGRELRNGVTKPVEIA